MKVLYTKCVIMIKDENLVASFLRKFDTEFQSQHDKSTALDSLRYETSCIPGWRANLQVYNKNLPDIVAYECVLDYYTHYHDKALNSTIELWIENLQMFEIAVINSIDL